MGNLASGFTMSLSLPVPQYYPSARGPASPRAGNPRYRELLRRSTIPMTIRTGRKSLGRLEHGPSDIYGTRIICRVENDSVEYPLEWLFPARLDRQTIGAFQGGIETKDEQSRDFNRFINRSFICEIIWEEEINLLPIQIKHTFASIPPGYRKTNYLDGR